MGQRLPSRRLVNQLQRITVASAYSDTANITQFTATGNDADTGQPTGTETETEIACSFTDKPKMENWKDFAEIGIIEAEIRFDDEDITPGKGDTIELIGRWDTSDYADTTFEIIGIRDRDAFGYVCALKKVTI